LTGAAAGWTGQGRRHLILGKHDHTVGPSSPMLFRPPLATSSIASLRSARGGHARSNDRRRYVAIAECSETLRARLIVCGGPASRCSSPPGLCRGRRPESCDCSCCATSPAIACLRYQHHCSHVESSCRPPDSSKTNLVCMGITRRICFAKHTDFLLLSDGSLWFCHSTCHESLIILTTLTGSKSIIASNWD
jgi:hypothetical protein